VNHYANLEFDLKFAAPDAETLGELFADKQKQLGAYQSVLHVKLLDKEATKANISLALALLAGIQHGAFPAAAPNQLRQLKPAQPEDAVVVYFAGHGVAWGDRFFLVPHDLGYNGARSDLRTSIQDVLMNSLSDQDLEVAFEPMQASHTLLVIDARNSGKRLIQKRSGSGGRRSEDRGRRYTTSRCQDHRW
jgi:uncharacterized caspase-like protein